MDLETINAQLIEMSAKLDQLLAAAEATVKEGADDAAIKAHEAAVDKALNEADALVKSINELEKKKSKIETAMKIKADNDLRIKTLGTPQHRIPSGTLQNKDGSIETGRAGKSRVFENNEMAYKAGRFYQAALGNNDEAKAWCENNGIKFKTLQSNIEGGAGLFVLPEIETAIIRLVQEYGIIRKYARVIKTTSATHVMFKRVSGNTMYFISEMGTPTSTDAAWLPITMTPKIAGVLTKYSLILDADAAVNIGDTITEEIALAIAIGEDACAFVGDGTSTYGGIIGIAAKFQQVLEAGGGTWTTDADVAKLAGAVVAAGNTFAEVTLQNFIDTKNKIARFPNIKPVWFIHDAAAAATMERLMYALSGNAIPNPVEGVPAKFLGYPIQYVNSMPFADADSQVIALFGDLNLGSCWCDRQGLEIATNTQSETNFLTRTAQVLATERFDYVVHSVGNFYASAASRTRGAIAALVSMTS